MSRMFTAHNRLFFVKIPLGSNTGLLPIHDGPSRHPPTCKNDTISPNQCLSNCFGEYHLPANDALFKVPTYLPAHRTPRIFPLPLPQHLLPSLSPRTLQLRHLTVAVELQRSSHPFNQLPATDLTVGITYMLTELIGKRPIIRPTNPGIRRGLIIPTAGKQHMLHGIARP